ncbi:hypothetical protein BVX94_03570 [bacterium B17]|nr:hypothetical protein BVX94_03570 [bacterium B17]
MIAKIGILRNMLPKDARRRIGKSILAKRKIVKLSFFIFFSRRTFIFRFCAERAITCKILFEKSSYITPFGSSPFNHKQASISTRIMKRQGRAYRKGIFFLNSFARKAKIKVKIVRPIGPSMRNIWVIMQNQSGNLLPVRSNFHNAINQAMLAKMRTIA